MEHTTRRRSTHDRLTVLVADDSALIRSRLVVALAAIPGVRVVGAAADGAEALALVRATRPDLVVLDVVLPVRSGLSVLAELGREPRPPRVAMLTNHADPAIRARSARLGAAHFFDKSTEFAGLLALCRRLARQADGTRTGNGP